MLSAFVVRGVAREGDKYHFSLTDTDAGAAVFNGAAVLARVTADLARVTADLARVTADLARVTADLARVTADLTRGVAVRDVARSVHVAVVDVILAIREQERERHGDTVIGLTGGVFQNVLLLSLACRRQRSAGFSALVHHLVLPNDGGIALGQAMIGARALER